MPAAPAGRAVPHARGTGRLPLPQSRHPARLHAGLRRPAREPAGAARAVRGRAGRAGRERVERRRLLGLRRPPAGPPRRPLGRRRLQPRPLDVQRQHAPDPRRGGAGGAHRPGPPGRAGAQDHHRAVRGQGLADACPPTARRATSRAGRTRSAGIRCSTWWSTPRSRGRWRSPGARARRSGSTRPPSDLIADRIISHDRGRVLALAGAAAEPDQLVRADVPGGGVGGRRPRGPAPAAAAAAQALRRRRDAPDERRDRRQPRPGLPLPLSPPGARGAQVQPRLRRVREHRLRLPGRLPAGARRRHGAAGLRRARGSCAPGPSACCRATGRTPAT